MKQTIRTALNPHPALPDLWYRYLLFVGQALGVGDTHAHRHIHIHMHTHTVGPGLDRPVNSFNQVTAR